MKDNLVITVGRQLGSGGRDMGIKLAQIFGIAFYDKKLVYEAAKLSGLTTETFEKRDERTPGSLVHALTLGLGFGSFSQENLFQIQSQAIKGIAAKEPCVIVGRCADYILRDNPMCFNIFVHGPIGFRTTNVSVRSNLDLRPSQELIMKTDKARAAYYNFYTGKKWGYSASYDLSVDSSIMGIEKSAQYVASFIREAVAVREENGYHP